MSDRKRDRTTDGDDDSEWNPDEITECGCHNDDNDSSSSDEEVDLAPLSPTNEYDSDLEDSSSESELNLQLIVRPPTPFAIRPRTIKKKIKVQKEKISVPINTQINNLADLIKLAEMYDEKYEYDCVIDIETLHNMLEPLKKLNAMIGMEAFKNSLINQIIFQLSAMRDKDRNKGEPQMLHTVLFGPAGAGKSSIAKIFGELYAKMGVLSRGHFTIAKRADLIARYLGQTAPKTLKVLEEAKGGVLLIDEVYALGPSSGDNEDIFSKECIDTINQYLSENAADFICIIAGYKEEVENSFFSKNPGLARRFPYRYTIEGYKPHEMYLIFQKFINESDGWSLVDQSIDAMFFQTNKDAFPSYGGDLKVFFDNCKIAHARRTFIMPPEHWKKLTLDDINKGFELYKINKEVGKGNGVPESIRHMWV